MANSNFRKALRLIILGMRGTTPTPAALYEEEDDDVPPLLVELLLLTLLLDNGRRVKKALLLALLIFRGFSLFEFAGRKKFIFGVEDEGIWESLVAFVVVVVVVAVKDDTCAHRIDAWIIAVEMIVNERMMLLSLVL